MIVNPHLDFSASAPSDSNQDEWPGGMQPLVAAWRCPASAEQCLLEVLQHKGKVGWDPMQSQSGERDGELPPLFVFGGQEYKPC